MKKRLILMGIVMAAIGMVLTIGPAQAADTVKIGVVGPRTGGAAATGQAFEEGIQLATAYVNAKGGVLGKNLEVVFQDTAGDPEKAASGFERLVTRDQVVDGAGRKPLVGRFGRNRGGQPSESALCGGGGLGRSHHRQELPLCL